MSAGAWAQPPEVLLRLQGSNTIGAELAPALVDGLLAQRGFQQIRHHKGDSDNELHIDATDARGQPVRIEVAAHGTSTGFSALAEGKADLAAASRPIEPIECQRLQRLGDYCAPDAAQVIALDGVAVLVNPANPLTQLDTDQLANIFAGRISRWEQLGAGSGPIHLLARDDRSGTFETFRERLLTPRQLSLAPGSRRFESSDVLSDAVSADPQAIGFVGLPAVRQAKPLAIVDGRSHAMLPDAALIATEDYPLSRRLYFYLAAEHPDHWAQALVRFAQSEDGQAIAERLGLVPQRIRPLAVHSAPGMPEEYRQLASGARRLSVSFRFADNSASLDSKAMADLARVMSYLELQHTGAPQLVLVGFGDRKDDPARAVLLSRLRAMAVRRELVRHGLYPSRVLALGEQLPVASNQDEEGRLRNRRVEIWIVGT